MSSGPLAGLAAFASAAPLAYAAATFAFATLAALALGPGPRRIATAAAIVGLALTLGAPSWGWVAQLTIVAGLTVGSLRRRRRASPAEPRADLAPATLLLGRIARVDRAGATPRVRLDGCGWRVRLEGGSARRDARVRVVRVERDGRLVVRLAGG